MTISKYYEGTLDDANLAGTRNFSYKYTATSSNFLINKIDFFNQTVADFLRQECGVDTVYEARDGDEDKYLWICDVPFLMYFKSGGSQQYVGVYCLSGASLLDSVASSSNMYVFENSSSNNYKFTLIFDGNPKTGFVLRAKTYGGNIPYQFCLRFMNAVNVVNGRKALIWFANHQMETVYSINNLYSVDIDEQNLPDMNSYNYLSGTTRFFPVLQSSPANKSVNLDKFPLVPIMVGVYKVPGVYCQPFGYGVPLPMQITQYNQVEFTVSGRRFLSTVRDSLAQQDINMGLIELTD